MFNFIFDNTELFIVTLVAFVGILVIRKLFIKSCKIIFIYHLILFLILFIFSVGGGSVINDGYKRLEEYIKLENSGQINIAKHDLKNYNSMLAIDLKQFKNSDEFRSYLKNQNFFVDQAEAIALGWLFVFLVEISIIITKIISYIYALIYKKLNKVT